MESIGDVMLPIDTLSPSNFEPRVGAVPLCPTIFVIKLNQKEKRTEILGKK